MNFSTRLRNWINSKRAVPGCKWLRVPDGTRFLMSLNETDEYHANVAAGTLFLDPTWQIAIALLGRDQVFFDVGANIGVFSIPAAMQGARVHAFELLNENVSHLQTSTELNNLKDLAVIQCAVSDQEGSVGALGYSAWGTRRPQWKGHSKVDNRFLR